MDHIDQDETEEREPLGGNMSFLEHLDEFRKRLVLSIIVVGVAFLFCWMVKEKIYNFLSIPVKRALTEAQRLAVPIEGLNGNEKILSITQLKEGEKGRFVFNKPTSFGTIAIDRGTSVMSTVATDSNGRIGLFTDETLYIGNAIIPKGLRLPVDFVETSGNDVDSDEKLVFTTAVEPFTLYVTVSLYGALVISIPFLLFQIWGFISPALYKHERKYVTPFILLSSISFVLGAAFAYYVLFPPAMSYLLGLGSEFTPFLKATDYFDFITLIMLAMGMIFQMPAVAYVLARIGIISAGFLIRSWKIALVVILIVAAFVSPTGDIPNMMLFAAPMILLYVVSIFVAWFFGKKRKSDPDDF